MITGQISAKIPKLSARVAVGIEYRCLRRILCLCPNHFPERHKAYKAVLSVTLRYATGAEVRLQDAKQAVEQAYNITVAASAAAKGYGNKDSQASAANSYYYAARSVVSAIGVEPRRKKKKRKQADLAENVRNCVQQAHESLEHLEAANYLSTTASDLFNQAVLEDITDITQRLEPRHVQADGRLAPSARWDLSDLRSDFWRGPEPEIILEYSRRAQIPTDDTYELYPEPDMSADTLAAPQDELMLQKTVTEEELSSIIKGIEIRGYAQLFPNIVLAGALGYCLSSTFWPGLEIMSALVASGIYFCTLAAAALLEKDPDYGKSQ